MAQEPLTAVRLISVDQPHVASLLHVALKIDSFILDAAALWSLESASECGFLRLLDRLLPHEWPGLSQKYRKLRLDHAVWMGYSLPIMRWWLERYMPGEVTSPVCRFMIQHKRLQVLQWLLEERRDRLMAENSQNCGWTPEIADWLHDYDRRLPIAGSDASIDDIKWCLTVAEDEDDCSLSNEWPTTVMGTVSSSRLELIERVRGYQPSPDVLETALRHGRLDVAKWLHQQFQNLGFPRLCCTDYTSTPDHQCQYCVWKRVDLEIARWVFCEIDWTDREARTLCAKRMARTVASRGQLDVLEYLFDVPKMPLQGKPMTPDDMILLPVCFDDAAANGHLAVIQLLHDHCQPCTTKAMDRAAGNNHLDVVQWLHEHRTEGCTTDAMDSAAKSGNMKVVQWLHENRTEGCTTQAMDFAAMTCQLETLQWLHKNRTEGWSRNGIGHDDTYQYFETVQWPLENGVQATWGIDHAAQLGELKVIQWLHENQFGTCSTFAMDAAARNGYLEIVQWLHENRTEGCTIFAMNYAAREGHLEIVQWLHENRMEGCSTDAMDWAVGSGHFDVVRFLHDNRAEGCSNYYAQRMAVYSGRKDIFKWLQDNYPERCSQAQFFQYYFDDPGSLNVLEFAARHSEYAPLGFAVDMLIKRGRFKAAETILREAHTNGRSLIESEFADVRNL